MKWLRRFRTDRRDSREVIAYLPLRDLDVVVGLKVQPEFRRRAEGLRQAQRGICGHSGFLIRQSFNARPWHAAAA